MVLIKLSTLYFIILISIRGLNKGVRQENLRRIAVQCNERLGGTSDDAARQGIIEAMTTDLNALPVYPGHTHNYSLAVQIITATARNLRIPDPILYAAYTHGQS